MPLPYYKRFPRDFFEGTIGLSFEAKAGYGLILDLIYMRDGRLEADYRYIGGLLGCSSRKAASLVSTLVELGKLQLLDGFISNFRADKLLESARTFSDKQSERASKPRENNSLEQPEFSQAEPESDTEEESCSTLSAGARELIDLRALETALLAAAGDKIDRTSPAARNLAPILNLMRDPQHPASWDDVIETVREKAARLPRPARSWAYFREAIIDARDRRIAGAPAPRSVERTNDHERPKSASTRKIETSLRGAEIAIARRRAADYGGG